MPAMVNNPDAESVYAVVSMHPLTLVTCIKARPSEYSHFPPRTPTWRSFVFVSQIITGRTLGIEMFRICHEFGRKLCPVLLKEIVWLEPGSNSTTNFPESAVKTG